jgi:hypothetical protein
MTMHSPFAFFVLAWFAALAGPACSAVAPPLAPAVSTAPPAPPAAAAAAPTSASPLPLALPLPLADASVATPADVAGPPALEIAYPFTGVTPIPDDCAAPSVTLTTAPRKMGWGYAWTWTRQAMLANPQFQIVEGAPARAMQVRLDMYEIPEGFALVALCKDGATCNKLAAMYRSTVQTCNPQLHCGALPIAGAPRTPALVPADGQWLPVEDADTVGRCARIGVCLRVQHEHFKGNPGVACQSAPTQFKVDCAKKATCAEVVACMKG